MNPDAVPFYDIIIVGCGLVGGSLALTLPKTLSIAIIDAESPMQKQPGYLALNIYSCQLLKQFDLWESIAQHDDTAITAIKAMKVSSTSNANTILLSHEDIGAPALGYVTSTTAIREVMMAKIQSQSNITLYCPAIVQDIKWPHDGLEKISVQMLYKETSQIITLNARLTIMADGGRSTLREHLGFLIHENKTQPSHHIFISQWQTSLTHKNQAFEHLTSEGPIALLPINQNEYLLIWTIKSNDLNTFLSQDKTNLMNQLKVAYPHIPCETWQEIGERKAYPIIPNQVKCPIKTRLVLMGNAAHTVHPVGAQGFNLSLKDVAVLSQLIHTAITENRDISNETLLNTYWKNRQEDTQFVHYFTQFLLNAFQQNTILFQKIRSLGFQFLNQSAFLKEKLLKQTTGINSNIPTHKIFSHTSQSSKQHYDIIILGNRLVGSALACTLNPRYRIAILDKASTPALPSGDYQLRINAYNRASETLLKAIHIWEKLPMDRCFAFDKIYATHESAKQTSRAELCFNAQSIHEPHIGHFIENDLVTHALHERIKTLAHVDFFDDTAIQEIHPKENTIEMITDDGRVFSSQLLAACDGAHSIARHLSGIDVSRQSYHQRCIVSNIFFDGDLDKTAWQCFLKTGPIGLLPLEKGVCSLAWSCDNELAEKLLQLDDEAFIDALNQAISGRLYCAELQSDVLKKRASCPRDFLQSESSRFSKHQTVTPHSIGRILRVSPRQAFPLAAQHAKRYVGERLMLLGDAAHTIHPLGGLGANLGFQDVIAAATLLNDPIISARDIGRRYLLEKYERSRHRHNTFVMKSMSLFNALFHDNRPLGGSRSPSDLLKNVMTRIEGNGEGRTPVFLEDPMATLSRGLGPLALKLTNNITPIKKALFKQAIWMNTSPEQIQALIQ